MTTITTATEARAQILKAIEFAGRDEVLAEIVQFNNTTENDIDEQGNVWVANPQTGHWFDEDRLVEFAKFLG
jgi:hypothetical protein